MESDKFNPNFPTTLNIKPLPFESKEVPDTFGSHFQQGAIREYGIAGRVWEAAELLVKYFELSLGTEWHFDPPCSLLKPENKTYHTIVELGSGTGYVGLRLAEKLLQNENRDDVLVLTDLPYVCPLLEKTLGDERSRWRTSHPEINDTSFVRILPLSWGVTQEAEQLLKLLSESRPCHERRHLTHIICSDLVYFPHLLPPLLRSLLQLTSPPFASLENPPEIIISYKIRSLSKETAFWTAFGLWFEFSPVLIHAYEKPSTVANQEETSTNSSEMKNLRIFGFDEDCSFIFIASRRSESLRWSVPENDEELLSGNGIAGSNIPLSDTTFESLLLMQIQGYEN